MSKATLLPTLLIALTVQSGSSESDPRSLTVLTFNIRYGTAKDEGHSWEVRKEAVAEVLREHRPDLTGLQEALDFQVEYLQDRLGREYSLVGEGREGRREGEFAPIFYRSDRFVLARAGRFWLSDTPEVVGSKTWASLPRIVTWVELFDRVAQRRLLVLNTHWAHDSDEARLKSAKLVRDRVGALAADETPVILMGDFNCAPDSEPYRILVNGGAQTFEDSLSAPNSEAKSTFHGFRGRGNERGPIDWILYRGDFGPQEYRVLEGEYLEQLPSDHYPVFARFDR